MKKNQLETKLESLNKRIETLKAQKDKLKVQNEKLKERLKAKDEQCKKLKKQLEDEGKVKVSPAKKLYKKYPKLGAEYRKLCVDWNLKTMNFNNTSAAIMRIIEPDDNGVVEYTEQDVINYILVLRKLGRAGYMKNPTLSEYYEPYDSLILFKHYKMIRKNLLLWLNPKQAKSESIGFKVGNVTLNGIEIKPRQQTAICTWEDLRNQKRGVQHINDNVDINEFKGDDRIRETERRSAKQSGYINEKSVRERMEYQANSHFGLDKMKVEQVLEATKIVEEDDDDDLDLTDFKEKN